MAGSGDKWIITSSRFAMEYGELQNSEEETDVATTPFRIWRGYITRVWEGPYEGSRPPDSFAGVGDFKTLNEINGNIGVITGDFPFIVTTPIGNFGEIYVIMDEEAYTNDYQSKAGVVACEQTLKLGATYCEVWSDNVETEIGWEQGPLMSLGGEPDWATYWATLGE